MPRWYLDEPILPPVLFFYINAFWDLSTERQVGFSIGPIPESKILEYGSRAGLNSRMLGVFKRAIRRMDSRYQKHLSDEQDKRTPAKKPKGRKR